MAVKYHHDGSLIFHNVLYRNKFSASEMVKVDK